MLFMCESIVISLFMYKKLLAKSYKKLQNLIKSNFIYSIKYNTINRYIEKMSEMSQK